MCGGVIIVKRATKKERDRIKIIKKDRRKKHDRVKSRTPDVAEREAKDEEK